MTTDEPASAHDLVYGASAVRALTRYEHALFDQPLDGCEHIGPEMPNWPNLCWLHPQTGLLCDACLVAHNQIDHDIADLTRRHCEACTKQLNRANKLDTDAHIATLRRSVNVGVTSHTRRIKLSRMVDDPDTGAPAIITTTYTGRTIIAAAHLLCFSCRQTYLTYVLQSSVTGKAPGTSPH